MMAIVPLIGLSLLAAAAMPAAAQATVQAADRGAIAAQAQTAWFAGDDAALGRAAASANGLATSSKAQDRYTQGFVQFRVLQRAIGAKRDKDAERAGAVCIAATEAAVKAEPKFAEAFALQSACYGYLANLGGLGAIRNGSRSGKGIEAALALEPRHPRVQLVDGTRAKVARASGPPPPLSMPRGRQGRGVPAGSSGAPQRPTSGSAAAPVRPETRPPPRDPSSGR